jgi:hypothetical protein
MATAMRVAGNKDAKGGKGNGNGNKGGRQVMVTATKRAIATAVRVAGKQRRR